MSIKVSTAGLEGIGNLSPQKGLRTEANPEGGDFWLLLWALVFTPSQEMVLSQGQGTPSPLEEGQEVTAPEEGFLLPAGSFIPKGLFGVEDLSAPGKEGLETPFYQTQEEEPIAKEFLPQLAQRLKDLLTALPPRENLKNSSQNPEETSQGDNFLAALNPVLSLLEKKGLLTPQEGEEILARIKTLVRERPSLLGELKGLLASPTQNAPSESPKRAFNRKSDPPLATDGSQDTPKAPPKIIVGSNDTPKAPRKIITEKPPREVLRTDERAPETEGGPNQQRRPLHGRIEERVEEQSWSTEGSRLLESHAKEAPEEHRFVTKAHQHTNFSSTGEKPGHEGPREGKQGLQPLGPHLYAVSQNAVSQTNHTPAPPSQTAPPSPTPLSLAPTQVPEFVKELALRPGRDGHHEARIRLEPPHLGELHISLSVDKGEVKLLFTVEHPQAAQALHQELHQLAKALSEAGLQLGGCEIGLGGGETQQFQEHTPQGPWWNPRAEAPLTQTEEVEKRVLRGLIDLRV